jgi:hypothetical protein
VIWSHYCNQDGGSTEVSRPSGQDIGEEAHGAKPLEMEQQGLVVPHDVQAPEVAWHPCQPSLWVAVLWVESPRWSNPVLLKLSDPTAPQIWLKNFTASDPITKIFVTSW